MNTTVGLSVLKNPRSSLAGLWSSSLLHVLLRKGREEGGRSHLRTDLPRNPSPPGYLQTEVPFLNLSCETAVVPWRVLCSSLRIRRSLFVASFSMYRACKTLLCHAKSFDMAIVYPLPDASNVEITISKCFQYIDQINLCLQISGHDSL